VFLEQLQPQSQGATLSLANFLLAALRRSPSRRALADAQAQRHSWTLADVAALRHSFSIFENNLRLMLTYDPVPHYGKVALVHAQDSGVDSRWQRIAQRHTATCVPGDHYSMLRPPQARTVAAAISAVVNFEEVAQ
jgi:thioesterase domain-containing protein